MAADEVKRHKRRRKHGATRDSKSLSHKQPDDHDTPAPDSVAPTDRPADIEALRKARLTYLAKPPEERRKEMKYEYVKRTRTASQAGGDKERKVKVVRPHTPEREPAKSSQKTMRRTDDHRRRVDRDDSEDDYVYKKNKEESPRKEAPTKTTTKQRTKVTVSSSSKPVEKRRVPERRHTEPVKHEAEQRNEVDEGRRHRTPTDEAQTLPRRSTVAAGNSPRPELKRSATSSKAKTEVSKPKVMQVNETPKKSTGLFGGLLLPKHTPPRKVSCLTCGADDIPIAESARLPCTHRMCHSCLKRIFTMSVTDPQHMPPRCCTDQHIDLKHVDKLFDQKFKVRWNRKYEEYKTKNRIYCPARKCGAWIKPHYIKMENGRKVGRCKLCKTRVCTLCSQKMHTTRECPKDPEAKAFVEVAKEQGWQRCYNCSAMVELKEGCNHMTCRCTAEFCMVCGLRWKSCDCPWFNYEAFDAHLGDPIRQQQLLDRRRDQYHRDEALARRMQQMGLGPGQGADMQEVEYGLGNAGPHQMNQNFIQQAREALTANYAQAGQAARDLLNGLVMGRENPLPGMPLPMEQMMEMLQQGGARDPAEGQYLDDHQGPAQPPARRATRRRNAVRDGANGGPA